MSKVNHKAIENAAKTSKYALEEALIEGEITLDEYAAAQGILFFINPEDVALFIQSIAGTLQSEASIKVETYLRNISHVSYGGAHECCDDYDGIYVVGFKDGSQQKLGWKDSDRVSVVYPID